MQLLLGLGLIILCCIIIWRASDGFETASSYLGRNLSDGVRGATINAIGSSVPELFTTFFFFFYYFYFLDDSTRANDGFAGGIGTTAGSAIFNGMIIPAIVILSVIFGGVARYIYVSRKVILRDGLSLICAELVLIYLISGTTLSWYHGLILMTVYGLYVTIMIRTMSNEKREAEEKKYYKNDGGKNTLLSLVTLDLAPIFIKENINKRAAWGLLLVSMFIIGSACFLLVYSCELSAHYLG
ncbi:MAG: sodium:calcium antiporter, partial [Bacteroidota bacterium]